MLCLGAQLLPFHSFLCSDTGQIFRPLQVRQGKCLIGASLSEPHIDHDNAPLRGIMVCMYHLPHVCDEECLRPHICYITVVIILMQVIMRMAQNLPIVQ